MPRPFPIPQSPLPAAAQRRHGGGRRSQAEEKTGERGRRRSPPGPGPDQQPPRRRPRQHQFPPPHQGQRSSPLNLELPCWPAPDKRRLSHGEVSRILSSHQGSGRRLLHLRDRSALEDWLRFPALDKSLSSATDLYMRSFRRRCRHRCAASRPLFALPTSAAALASRMEATPARYSTCRFSSSSASGMSQSLRLL